MCLTVSRHYHNIFCRPKKSKQEIKVAKLLIPINSLKHYAITPYQCTQVEFDERGLCIMKAEFSSKRGFDNHKWTKEIFCGIHAYRDKSLVDLSCTKVECKFYPALIPANTSYYIGRYGDIVAEEMIIFKDVQAYANYTHTSFM